MPLNLYIPEITGTPLFYIYVCDCSKTNCYQIDPITGVNIPPPFQFEIPQELSGETCYVVRVIDAAGCVSEEEVNLGVSGVNTLWQRVVPLTTPTPSVTEGYIYPTPSVTKTPSPTPSITRTNTPTPTPSLTQGFTPGVYFFVHIPNGSTLTCP